MEKYVYCPACGEMHEKEITTLDIAMPYLGVDVAYKEEVCFCRKTGIYYANEEQMEANFKALRCAYKERIKQDMDV